MLERSVHLLFVKFDHFMIDRILQPLENRTNLSQNKLSHHPQLPHESHTINLKYYIPRSDSLLKRLADASRSNASIFQ